VEIAKAVIRTGRHPAVCKRVSGVIIRNPGKNDNTKLNTYRSIFLLSLIGKVVETVVAELLDEEAVRRGPLNDGQFGSRKRAAAIDVAAIIVDRTHAAWRTGSLAGVLLMDIKASFPSVGRGRLVYTIPGKGIDRDLIQSAVSFLSNQTIEMIIEGNVMQRCPVEAEIPQGSPVFPILFAMYTSGLIKLVDNRVSGIDGLPSVDDVGWIATGSDISQVVKKHESWARESIDQEERWQLKFDTT
jgi:hypothetical protein